MAEERVKRRLAAIVVADVVGYSRLMEEDEVTTLATLKERRATILQPIVRAHGGRVVKVMGDGVLLEFASAVNALSAAIELQRKMADANTALPEARRIVLRIGINLGDVVIDGSDLYGDGVNIAARLQSLAEPGAIYVAAAIRDQVNRKLPLSFDDLGPKSLKNIAEPVHVYRPLFETWATVYDEKPATLPLPAKPSIAVLPFTNMSGEAEQEAFADGLTEDLITDLSRNAGLFVIARHSTFAYKGKSIDVRVIARDLGVRYILEGSARRTAGRMRINVQLIDAVGGGHLWAERFDRSLEDIFSVQDEVIGKIVEALVGQLVELPPRKRPKSLEAYDVCVRGRSLISSFTSFPEAIREAQILLERAILIEPEYSEASRWLAFVHWQLWAHSIEPSDENRSRALELARRAVQLDGSDAAARWVLGYLLAYEKSWPASDTEFKAAFRLEPNNTDALVMSSELAVYAGQPLEAIDTISRALRLNPRPPGWYYWELGLAYYAAGRYVEAVKTLRMEATYRSASRRILAASLAQLGRKDEAIREAALFMAKTPNFTIAHWAAAQPARDMETVQRFVEGYRMAGLR
ncbi:MULTISPECIES: adenylate/guanylate cyclase domain-containing protein [Rhizobium]|uniref:Adenylate cyclase 2 n=1 Tax=Rhizobium phaseoli TaxID=396 RepID=A0A192T8R7_9HYPH|nr:MULTISPECIES: adenylate/guanylate cyclase domain-containing protein [Rhizobium]EGE55665.1 adenylate cyclase protein [Rhizobium etli CNPAF512]ANL40066.1 adenylate cyclase 2 [Rhizobium phaseoli]ANL52769.1 adenylate cyclase 2 [Rhizobium phaseoli]ANL59055.1 adenylate cyclase 2 [Rhizobium phaseoli]ANL84383.1 adenylate cyclase 2 [Rhizobium phaseoli]